MQISYPELITEFRPDDEDHCPICGMRYLVIQCQWNVESCDDPTRVKESDEIRVGCWEHWNEPHKILRIEPLRSINGIPATIFAEAKIPGSVERNCNGYGMEPGLPLHFATKDPLKLRLYLLRCHLIWYLNGSRFVRRFASSRVKRWVFRRLVPVA